MNTEITRREFAGTAAAAAVAGSLTGVAIAEAGAPQPKPTIAGISGTARNTGLRVADFALKLAGLKS